MFGRRWLRAFDHLDETAKRVSSGDLTPLQMTPMPTAEMERLLDLGVDGIVSDRLDLLKQVLIERDDWV